ncbi:hypothetical protein WJX72_010536 [[Myrmecia] bisecta]|uniref:Glycerophosphocholine acyltransferase 1 n=1 Tax=[Myrmecia] bisecta TaxID=41462 RepID=A0AAW1Q3H7_9CHLO
MPKEAAASEIDDKAPTPAAKLLTPAKQLAQRLNVLGDLSPSQHVMRDKIGFFFGVVNLVISAFWLGRSTHNFYLWFTLKAVVLYSTRYYLYSKQRWQYYMLEFCYFANLLQVLEVWVFPGNALLHKITFAQVAGPLTWSIVALRNSLVLHSLDKTTSLFMHISPAVVAWTTKWYPDRAHLGMDKWSQKHLADWDNATVWELAVLSMGPYLLWSLAYYLKIFVVSRKKVQEEGYATLYALMTKNKNAAAARIVLKAPPALQPAVYMGMHLLLCWAAVLTTLIWWRSYWAHTIFLILCAAASAWNGATYYFDVFAHRYVSGVGIEPKVRKADGDSKSGDKKAA